MKKQGIKSIERTEKYTIYNKLSEVFYQPFINRMDLFDKELAIHRKIELLNKDQFLLDLNLALKNLNSEIIDQYQINNRSTINEINTILNNFSINLPKRLILIIENIEKEKENIINVIPIDVLDRAKKEVPELLGYTAVAGTIGTAIFPGIGTIVGGGIGILVDELYKDKRNKREDFAKEKYFKSIQEFIREIDSLWSNIYQTIFEELCSFKEITILSPKDIKQILLDSDNKNKENIIKIGLKYKEKVSDIFFTPNIPEKKIINAIKSYARIEYDESIICLYDSTIFGKADEGVCLTEKALYWGHSYKPEKIIYSKIQSIKRVNNDLFINDTIKLSCYQEFVLDAIMEILTKITKNNTKETDENLFELSPIEEIICKHLQNEVYADGVKVFDFFDDLTIEQIAIAKNSYPGNFGKDEKLICLYDSTSSKMHVEGICFSDKGVYWKKKGVGGRHVAYNNIAEIATIYSTNLLINGIDIGFCPKTSQVKEMLEEIINSIELFDTGEADRKAIEEHLPELSPIEKIICRHLQVEEDSTFSFYNDIPAIKKDGAMISYLTDFAEYETLVCLYDSSVSGDGRQGICLSDLAIYWKKEQDQGKRIYFEEITKVIVKQPNKLFINDEEVASCPSFILLKNLFEEIIASPSLFELTEEQKKYFTEFDSKLREIIPKYLRNLVDEKEDTIFSFYNDLSEEKKSEVKKSYVTLFADEELICFYNKIVSDNITEVFYISDSAIYWGKTSENSRNVRLFEINNVSIIEPNRLFINEEEVMPCPAAIIIKGMLEEIKKL